jgi:hypothetical protein
MSSDSRRIRHEAQSKPKFSDEKPTDASGKNGDLVYVRSGNGIEEFVKDEGRWMSLSTGRPSDEKAYISRVSARRGGGGNVAASSSSSGTSGNHNLLSNLNDDDHSQYVHITSNRTVSAVHTYSGNSIFSGNPNFSGTPTFSGIDINGGDIASGTVVNKSPVITLAGDLGGNVTLTNLASGTLTATIQPNSVALTTDTTGNYMTNVTGNSQVSVSHTQGEGSTATFSIAGDSIGDTQLAYNTGQHLTTSSNVQFGAITSTTLDTGQGANELYDMNQNVLTTSSPQFSNMTMGEWSDPNYSNGNIGTAQFASGFTGSGWKIDRSGNEYTFEADNMTIRGTLSVYELLIQQIRATNGSIFVSAAAKVDSVSGSAGSETIVFEDPSDHGVCPFAVGDIIMAQRVRLDSTTLVKRIVRQVYSVNGKTIVVTTTSGGPSDTGGIESGFDFVRLGNVDSTNYANRQGGVYLTADDSNAPFIDVFDGVTSWSQWTGYGKTKVRLGKLDGITDTDSGLSGSQSDLYGLYSDSVYLTGHIKANSGSIGGISMASSKLYTGTGTFNNSNTGVYIDSSSNFSLGDKFAWNNSTLAIDGSVTIGGTTASVVVSGASAGGTANQSSTASILSGNLTGTVDGTAVGTVKDGAAEGATANQDSTGTIQASGTKTGGSTGGWTINSDAIFTGTKVTTGYSANGSITLNSNGEIHTPTFYVESNGSSAFKGTLTIGSTNLTETNTFNSNTTKTDVDLANVDDTSDAAQQTATLLAADADDVGLNNVANESPSTLKTTMALNNVDNTSDVSVLGTAATAANTASKTSGYVGGWQINSTSIIGVASGSAQIVLTASGNIATGQWSINRDGSASFANGGITFATNGDITSNTFLLERTRLFGAGEDGTCTLYASTVESTYEGGNGTNQVNSQHGQSIITRSGNTWSMQGDCYFDTLTISAAGGALTLVTNGYRLFVKNTFTIASSCYVSSNGGQPSGWDDGDAYGGGSTNGTLSRGAQGHSGGSAGSATGGGGDGGRGGAAGGGGGIVFISARIISNSGYIHAKGGNGHAGQIGDAF